MNLITGATGLLGSYLAKFLLSKGEKVRAIKRASSDLSLLGNFATQIDWIEGDVLDIFSLEKAMKGVKRVYHCAAVISFLPDEHEQMTKANVEGTANVMNAALNNGIKKAVHVSSVAAFGIAPENKLIDEKFFDPQIAKRFAYYKSKHFAEREAWRANAEGLNLIVVCPSTILGAGWWNAQPNSLFREIYNGLKFYTSSINGFVDVRDVAECMYRLMNSEISGEKFIVSSENLSFREVMWMMADELNAARPPLEAGKFLREIVWRTEAVKHRSQGKLGNTCTFSPTGPLGHQ